MIKGCSMNHLVGGLVVRVGTQGWNYKGFASLVVSGSSYVVVNMIIIWGLHSC